MSVLVAVQVGACVRLLDPDQMRIWELECRDAGEALGLSRSLSGAEKGESWCGEPTGHGWREITHRKEYQSGEEK
jgi:hypothetical protein